MSPCNCGRAVFHIVQSLCLAASSAASSPWCREAFRRYKSMHLVFTTKNRAQTRQERQETYEVIFDEFIQNCDQTAYSDNQWNILACCIYIVDPCDLVPRDDQLNCRDRPDETSTTNDSVENMAPASRNFSQTQHRKQ
jgi:hypothetical protein